MNDSDDKQTNESAKDLFSRYKKTLGGPGSSSGGFESTGPSGPDLSRGGIKERLEFTKSELDAIIKDYLGDDPGLYEIADEIVGVAHKSLRILRDEDEDALNDDRESHVGALETIVRTDGSRPSFMIRNGEADRKTSPLGDWARTLDDGAANLHDAIAAVGRINNPAHVGTGFLIGEDLIVTNRHVLQGIGGRGANGKWTFSDETTIDFGFEFRAVESINRRRIKSLVFCGSKPIDLDGNIDHRKLDLALLKLEPATAATKPGSILSVDVAPDWADPDTTIFTIGYPGPPPRGAFAPSLIEQLFLTTFGYKRLAPGIIIPSQQHLPGWTTAHDATTLGGNSGSVVLVAARETVAAGLHYGGRTADPSENWSHVLGSVLDEKPSASDGLDENKTLRECLTEHGVKMIDRFNP